MKKIIFGLLLIIVLGVAAILAIAVFKMDYVVEKGLETAGSKGTLTKVDVENVSVQLFEGKAGIGGIRVENPPGFDNKLAISLGEVFTHVDLSSLSKQPIVINEIRIGSPTIFYEMNEARLINFNSLMTNIKSSIPASEGGSAPAGKGSDVKIVIRSFVISDAKVDAKITPLKKEFSGTLSKFELKNLGGQGGQTPGEITRQVLEQIQTRITKRIRDKKLVEKAKAKIDEKVDAEKERLERKAKDKLKGLIR